MSAPEAVRRARQPLQCGHATSANAPMPERTASKIEYLRADPGKRTAISFPRARACASRQSPVRGR